MSQPTDATSVAKPAKVKSGAGRDSSPSASRLRVLQGRLAAGLGILWALFLVVAQLGGAFEDIEQPLLDLRQALPAPTSAKNLALVAIDDIPSDRPWPWPRLDYALLLRGLLPFAPQSVVFEIPMQNPDPIYTAFDSAFANLVGRYDHIVFAATALTSSDQQLLPGNIDNLPARGLGRPRAKFNTIHGPLSDFAAQSSIGIVNLLPVNRRVPRHVPLVFQVRNSIVPGLSLQAAAQFLGASMAESEVVFGDAIYLRSSDGKLLRHIPVDDEGRLRVRFRRIDPPIWRISFDNVILYAEQMQGGEKPAQDLTQLRHRQVWVGRIDKSVAMPGIFGVTDPLSPVEVHMAAARNIIDEDLIRTPSSLLLVFAYLVVGGFGAILLLRYPWKWRFSFAAVVVALWWAAACLLYQVANIDLPMVSFALVVLGWLPVVRSAERWDLDTVDPLSLDLG